jgi:hypothetical protein
MVDWVYNGEAMAMILQIPAAFHMLFVWLIWLYNIDPIELGRNFWCVITNLRRW